MYQITFDSAAGTILAYFSKITRGVNCTLSRVIISIQIVDVKIFVNYTKQESSLRFVKKTFYRMLRRLD